MVTEWLEPVGSMMTRDTRREKYGGAIQGGICPSRSTPNVFVHSDPAEGARYGYTYDGWADDGSVFFYTGAGATGDQVIDGSSNARILHHRAEGRSLRLFTAVGERTQPGGKRHRYVGEFDVDPDLRYDREDALDAAGEVRSVVIFRLRPVGEAYRDENLSSPVSVGPISQLAELEATDTQRFEIRATSGTIGLRREARLVSDYRSWLENKCHEVKRWRLQPPGVLAPVWTDLYDQSAHELYEAKGTAARGDIRMAVGQLLDYRRHVSADCRLAVLVPVRPSEDLLDLLHSCGVSCVYPVKSGFHRIDPAPS